MCDYGSPISSLQLKKKNKRVYDWKEQRINVKRSYLESSENHNYCLYHGSMSNKLVDRKNKMISCKVGRNWLT